MRKRLLTVAALIVCFVGYIGWYRWDSSVNRGNEFGYYGQFNRVSNTLAAIPGVKINQSRHNADVTLEEFSFDLTVGDRPIQLFFRETDPIRSMDRDAALVALQNRISAEVASSNTNK